METFTLYNQLLIFEEQLCMYNFYIDTDQAQINTAYLIWATLCLLFSSLKAQSTYIYRAPQCMSPRLNWDSPTPLAASNCALPPGPKGGGAHSPAAKGVGESQFQRLEKRLALCLLCG